MKADFTIFFLIIFAHRGDRRLGLAQHRQGMPVYVSAIRGLTLDNFSKQPAEAGAPPGGIDMDAK